MVRRHPQENAPHWCLKSHVENYLSCVAGCKFRHLFLLFQVFFSQAPPSVKPAIKGDNKVKRRSCRGNRRSENEFWSVFVANIQCCRCQIVAMMWQREQQDQFLMLYEIWCVMFCWWRIKCIDSYDRSLSSHINMLNPEYGKQK